MLALFGRLALPPFESLDPAGARALSRSLAASSPPGPAVGAVVDGVFPGAAGELAYRLYRPPTPGPHPVVAYFHGGGYVTGTLDATGRLVAPEAPPGCVARSRPVRC